MYPLSDKAKALIETFEKQIENLSASERAAVLRRMTDHVNALTEEAQDLLTTIQHRTGEAMTDKETPSGESHVDSITDYL